MLDAVRIGAWSPSGAPLPYLRRVAYLESHGTEYIDTLCRATKNIAIKVDIEPLEITGNALIGFAEENNNAFRLFNYGSSIYFDLTGSLTRYIGSTLKINERCVIEFGNWYLKKDEIILLNNNFKDDAAWSNTTIWLFGGNGNFIKHYKAKERIYSFALTNGESSISFLPVLDLSGRPAMFDEVSGQFFYNQGTGEFTWGEID